MQVNSLEKRNSRNLRFIFAQITAKAAMFAMQILGRNATYLPGRLAINMCPDFIGRIERPETVVAVTGTNGKTTVCNMINDVLEASGIVAANNRLGSNVDAGIASALIANSSLFGKAKKKLAILEVDERSSLKIYPYLAPDYIICTNLFRDSVKRNAHTEFISYILTRAIPETSTLILNGDDVVCSGIGSEKNKRIYFGLGKLPTDTEEITAKALDIAYCPKCSAKLKYNYVHYNHIGSSYCPDCDFKSADCDYLMTEINHESGRIKVRQHGTVYEYKMVNDNLINISNMTAAIALLSELGEKLGLGYEQISAAFESIKPVSTRYNEAEAGGVSIVMQLSKGQNPIACSRAFSYVAEVSGEKAVLLNLDDRDESLYGSESVSWLYDTDYSYFKSDSIKKIAIGGVRRYDQLLRMLIEGVPREKIALAEFESDTGSLINLDEIDKVCVLYDLFLIDTAEKLKQDIISRKKEGK